MTPHPQLPPPQGWDLLNEPRCAAADVPECAALVGAWLREMSDHLRSLTPRQLILVGSDGFWGVGPDQGVDPDAAGAVGPDGAAAAAATGSGGVTVRVAAEARGLGPAGAARATATGSHGVAARAAAETREPWTGSHGVKARTAVETRGEPRVGSSGAKEERFEAGVAAAGGWRNPGPWAGQVRWAKYLKKGVQLGCLLFIH